MACKLKQVRDEQELLFLRITHHFHQFLKNTGFVNLLHLERPKLHTILAFLSAIGLKFLNTGTDRSDHIVQTLIRVCH